MTAVNEIISVDPAHPSVEVGRFRIELGAVGTAVHAARAAFPAWSARTPEERAEVLRAWAAVTTRHAERISTLLTRETGKTIAEARQEAALLAARPHSTLDIAEDLATMAFTQKAKQAEREKALVRR